MSGEYERGIRYVLKRIQEAERIDAQHGFTLPGDSALYITLWGLECDYELTINPAVLDDASSNKERETSDG